MVVAVGLLAAIATLFGKTEAIQYMHNDSDVGGALLILIVTFLIALPIFSIAEFFLYIGKTAFHAELMSDNLIMDSNYFREAAAKVFNQLKDISDKQAKYIAPSPLPVASISPTINCPHCNQRILQSALVNGMNVCPKCKSNFKVSCWS